MAGTFKIVFDGGALGNPGKGYGSFLIEGPDGYRSQQRLDFGDRITNNQAEYRTLIGALKQLQADLGPAATTATIEIFGDSLLVINQVNGTWKVKNVDLGPLRDEVRALLIGFGKRTLSWHGRDNSVRVLGH